VLQTDDPLAGYTDKLNQRFIARIWLTVRATFRDHERCHRPAVA
jgi:hypothetical protein